jgi:hypothetical protein
MFKLSLVPIALACFIVYGFLFPAQPPTTVHCMLEIHSANVRISAEEIGVEMVPIAHFNNRSFYYLGITHNLEPGPYVITYDNQVGYFRPFNQSENSTIERSNLPVCTSVVPAR